jgi:hypothetical protein
MLAVMTSSSSLLSTEHANGSIAATRGNGNMDQHGFVIDDHSGPAEFGHLASIVARYVWLKILVLLR